MSDPHRSRRVDAGPGAALELSADQAEHLASALHGLVNTSGMGWDELAPRHRDATLAGARYVPVHLARLGLGVRPAARPAPLEMGDEEVEQAARDEHDRWAAYTRSLGYRYGPTRDDDRRFHPDLVEWDELDEAARDKDRERVRAIPAALAAIGLEVVRRPPDGARHRAVR